MTKNIWVNPLLGDSGTVRFLRAPIEESSTSNPETDDTVPEEVKTGFYNTNPVHPKKNGERPHRRGHRGRNGY